MGPTEMVVIAGWIDQVVGSIERSGGDDALRNIADEVRDLASRFPAPGLPVS